MATKLDEIRVVDLDDDVLVDDEQDPDLLVDLKCGLIFLDADIVKLSHDLDVLNQSLAELDILVLDEDFFA